MLLLTRERCQCYVATALLVYHATQRPRHVFIETALDHTWAAKMHGVADFGHWWALVQRR